MISEKLAPQVKALLEQVLDLSPGEQRAILARRRSEHPEVCARVEGLLAQAQPAFLDDLAAALRGADWLPPAPPGVGQGTRLTDYAIEEEIGRGGMAVVYRARQLSLNRVVALKMMLGGQFASITEVERFRSEAESVARLQHPNIVQIHAIGEHDGLPFLALEYVDGGTLCGKLAGQPLAPEHAALLAQTLAQAIHHAHERGIVHLDLKPGNILLALAGTARFDEAVPKITDFGLARRWEESGLAPAVSNVIRGTPSYMAPEQAARSNTAKIGRCSDVYALGAVLYEMLTGRPPFRATTTLETLELVHSQEPVPPRQLYPKVPRDLETICLKCLSKEPGQRYITAQDLAEDLGRLLQGRPIQARPVGVVGRVWRWCRRRPGVAGLTAALILALVSGLVGSLYLWRQAEDSAALAQTNERRARAQEERAVQHLRAEEAARQWAEDQSRQTRQLLVKCFQVSRDPSLQRPTSQPVRLELLLEIEARYRQLLRERGDDPVLRAELAEVTTSVGGLHLSTGHIDKARPAFQKALGLWQGLVREHSRSREYRAGLARAHEWMVSVHQGEGYLPRQLQSFEEAYRLWQALARERPTPEVLRSLASCSSEIGGLTAVVTPVKARRHLEEARGLLTQLLAADPRDRRARQVLAATYLTLAELHYPQAPKERVRCWRLAYDLYRQLHREEPGVIGFTTQLARCCLFLSEGRAKDPLATQAIALYDQSRRQLEDQYRADPENANVAALVGCYQGLGYCYQQVGRKEQAMDAFQRCAELGQQLATRHPHVVKFGWSMVDGLCGVALIQLETGRPAQARTTARQAVAAFARLARGRSFSADAPQGLWGQFKSIASCLRLRGDAAEALALAQRVKDIFEELYRESPDQGIYGFLASEAWLQIAKSRWRLGPPEKTEAALRQALQVQRQVCDRFPGLPEYQLALAERWFRLGRFLVEQERRAEAEKCFLEQVKLCPHDAVKLTQAARELKGLAEDVAGGRAKLSTAEQAEQRRYQAAADRVARQAAAVLAGGTVRSGDQGAAEVGKR
jgi:serine/threonine protein kinase